MSLAIILTPSYGHAEAAAQKLCLAAWCAVPCSPSAAGPRNALRVATRLLRVQPPDAETHKLFDIVFDLAALDDLGHILCLAALVGLTLLLHHLAMNLPVETKTGSQEGKGAQ